MTTTTTQAEINSPRTTGRSAGAEQLRPADDIVDYLKTYARQKPEVAALWCFGVGFVVGWKLKPW